MLAWSHLVMTGLGADTKPPELLVKVPHELRNTCLDGSVVVIVHLLALGCPGSEERAARENQVTSFDKVALVDQEVLLLWTYGGDDALHVIPEQAEDLHGLSAYGLHASEKRCLLVQDLSSV